MLVVSTDFSIAMAHTPLSTIRWDFTQWRFGINDKGEIVGYYVDNNGAHGFDYVSSSARARGSIVNGGTLEVVMSGMKPALRYVLTE